MKTLHQIFLFSLAKDKVFSKNGILVSGVEVPNPSVVGKAVRASLYLYLSTVISQALGYVFWLTMTGLIGAEGLGHVVAVTSLSYLVIPSLSLGLRASLARHLGESYGRGDIDKFRQYFSTAVAFTAVTTCTISLLMGAVAASGLNIAAYTPTMLILASIMVLTNLGTPFNSLMVALRRTDLILLSNVVGGLLKIGLGIALALLTHSWVGAALSYTSTGFSLIVVGLAYTLVHLKPFTTPTLEALKSLIIAGLSVWVPTVITTMGQQLGTIAIFGFRGALETGLYYVAFTVSGLLTSIPVSVASVLTPTLAGLGDGRKRAAWKAISLSMALTTPLAVGAALYSSNILMLLGEVYGLASPLLTILAIASIPQTILLGVNSLVYAYGMYRRTLILGVATNVTRVALYLVLTPVLGGYGAALAMASGSVSGFLAALCISRRVGFFIDWSLILKSILVPTILGLVYLLKTPWLVGLLVIGSSYLIYPRIGVVTRDDLRDLAYSVLSEHVTVKMYHRLKNVIDLVIPPT